MCLARSCGAVPHSESSRPALMRCRFCQMTGGSTQLGRLSWHASAFTLNGRTAMQRRLPGVAPNLGTCSQITRLRGQCIDRSHFDREYGHKPRVRRRDLTVLRTWSSDSAAYFMALRSLCTQVEAARPQCRTGAPDWLSSPPGNRRPAPATVVPGRRKKRRGRRSRPQR
jgi:hypothetical protein